MKKVLLWALAIFLVWNGIALADNGFDVGGQKGKIWSFINDYEAATGSVDGYGRTTIPTTLIPVGGRILGFSVQTLGGGNSENVAGLYDTVMDERAMNECIAEVESVDDSFDGQWFIYPLTVEVQITLIQGNYTRVIVYYVR